MTYGATSEAGISRLRQLITDFLVFGTVSAFAIAQPLYSILGQNPEFFVAQQIGPLGLLLFVGALSIAVPVALALVAAALDLLSPVARKLWLSGVVGILIGIAALPFLWRIIPDYPAVATAAIVAAIASALALRLSSFLAFAFPLTIAFPILFLIFSPASGLFAKSSASASAKSIENPAPIVMIIFDEFNLTALLDKK